MFDISMLSYVLSRGRGAWMIFNFLIVQVYFIVCKLNFIVLFPSPTKY